MKSGGISLLEVFICGNSIRQNIVLGRSTEYSESVARLLFEVLDNGILRTAE
jgi:hypothetical protein